MKFKKIDDSSTALSVESIRTKYANYTNPISNSEEEFIESFLEQNINSFKSIATTTTPIKIENENETDSNLMINNIILSFEELENNWDGYGAKELHSDTICNAQIFVKLLPKIILNSLEIQNIYPAGHGTIFFDFERDNKKISIEIGRTKLGFYSTNLSSDVSEDGIEFSNRIPINLLKALNELYADMPAWTLV